MARLLDDLRKYYPQARMRTGSYKDDRGDYGRPVEFYNLAPDGGWISEREARRHLLVARVLENRANRKENGGE